MEKVDYDSAAECYDIRYQRSYRADGLRKKLHDIVKINRYRSILEVGCGTGYWLDSFPEGTMTIGIDASLGMLERARFQKHLCPLAQGDGSLLPFKGKMFDFIAASMRCITSIGH